MKTKLDIISGFLGAGKTTLIKKLLEEGLVGEKVALIENEFGEVGIDGALLKDYAIEIKEMNSGCICCTIAGDFTLALKDVLKTYKPDRVIIEPSGVGKLSDVLKGCSTFFKEEVLELNMCITVVDGTKYKMYLKNFSEFYKDQLVHAKTIVLSRAHLMEEDKVEYILSDMKQYNKKAAIIKADWNLFNGKILVDLAEDAINKDLVKEKKRDTYRIVRNSDKGINNIQVGCDKVLTHHADEVFTVWGIETSKKFDRIKVEKILESLKEQAGFILRAKGILETTDKEWIQFDYVPDEINITTRNPDDIGRICIIGENINKEVLAALFEEE